jgi:WD40 repeat protein
LDLAMGARRDLGPRGVATSGVQFTRDGKVVALGSEDGVVRLLDVADGRELLAVSPPARAATMDNLPDPPRAVDLDPEGRHLAAIYLSGRVRL